MDWNYLFRHWIGTLLISPFVCSLVYYFFVPNSNNIVGLVEVYPITILFSLFFSAPTYLFVGLLLYFLIKMNISNRNSKLIFISIITLCILFTFHIVFDNREFIISVSYAISSIFLGRFLNYKSKNSIII